MKKSFIILLLFFSAHSFAQKPDDTLPVELYYFEAEIVDTFILLKWGTATEINNYGFNVERGNFDMSEWETLGFIEGHGTSFSPKHYIFEDTAVTANEIYNYRLFQIDNDGGTEYSDTVSIKFVVSSVEELAEKISFGLQQNFPNPFNPSTKIVFKVGSYGLVRLGVYDLLGREVATLIDEQKPAGEYEIQFNAEGLSSGTYFYRLSSGSSTLTKKLQIIK